MRAMFPPSHWTGVVLAYAVLSSCLLLAPSGAAAPLNPNISVIGDTRLGASAFSDRVSLEFAELELAWVGPVNPYASAEVFVAFHGLDIIEIEEAKLLLDRALPFGFGMTIGHALQDFGQINPVHLHAYPFVFRPLMHEAFFGVDGAKDTTARLDWLAPIDAFTLQATAGAIRGSSLQEPHHEHDDTAGGADAHSEPELGMSGRLSAFFEPDDDVSFRIGTSVLHGEQEPGSRITWWDVDAKAVWDVRTDRALVVNAEATWGRLDATDEDDAARPQGWFASADLRWNRRWNLGGFGETSDDRTGTQQAERYGGFIGFALLEESTLFRLVVHSDTIPEEGTGTGFQVQTLFGLGPHRPHRY